MDSETEESPAASAAATVYPVMFGVVVMTVGALMLWGLTRDLDRRWAQALEDDGYGDPAKVAQSQQDFAAFPGKLASWKVREGQRLETVKLKVGAEADEKALAEELSGLRDAAEDSEPSPEWRVLMPTPQGWWARFVGLSTGSRVGLFKGVMIAPLFLIIGLFIAMGGIFSLISERGARRLMTQLPERPWLHVSDWSALQGISSASGNLAGILMMLSVFGWAALWAGGMWIFEPEPPWNFTFIAFMALFCAGIIFLLALRRLVQALKYGKTRLLLGQVPIEPGKSFASQLMVPPELAGVENLKAIFKVQKVTTEGSGKNARRHLVTLFKREQVVPRSAFINQGGRLALQLRFEVPEDQPTSHYGDGPGYHWTLEVNAETSGVDFEETFEVPVYRLEGNPPLLRTHWDG